MLTARIQHLGRRDTGQRGQTPPQFRNHSKAITAGERVSPLLGQLDFCGPPCPACPMSHCPSAQEANR